MLTIATGAAQEQRGTERDTTDHTHLTILHDSGCYARPSGAPRTYERWAYGGRWPQGRARSRLDRWGLRPSCRPRCGPPVRAVIAECTVAVAWEVDKLGPRALRTGWNVVECALWWTRRRWPRALTSPTPPQIHWGTALTTGSASPASRRSPLHPWLLTSAPRAADAETRRAEPWHAARGFRGSRGDQGDRVECYGAG